MQPGKDNKVLADWNGLVITALVNASLAFEKAEWLAAAMRAFAFVRDTMSVNGRLRHSWRAGKLNHPATLDDYANTSRAALALFEATGDYNYMDCAIAWTYIVDAYYLDQKAGGYFLATYDTPNLIAQTKSMIDNTVPSGNGTMAHVFSHLYYRTGELRYLEQAQRIIFAFSGELQHNIFPLAILINANELMLKALQIVVIGERGDIATDALLRTVYGHSLPNRIVLVETPGETLPKSHPASGKGQIDRKPTAYVCEGQTCLLPHIDPDALRTDLATR